MKNIIKAVMAIVLVAGASVAFAATATPTPSSTPTPKATATPTPTPKATATPTPTPKATATPTPTPTPLSSSGQYQAFVQGACAKYMPNNVGMCMSDVNACVQRGGDLDSCCSQIAAMAQSQPQSPQNNQ